MLHDDNIDVLCICETWLESELESNFIHIPNYNIYRYDTGRGGGVCIIIRDDFKVTKINTGIDRIDGVDDIWVQIQYRKFPSFIVGCIYRHPKALVMSFTYLSDVFKYVCLKNKPVVILGDFNDNILQRGNNMIKVIKNLNLTQIIEQPTRITACSSTLLDLLITNKTEFIDRSSVSPSPVADHEMISVIINIRKPKPKSQIITYRCRKHYNANNFCNLLLAESSTLNGILKTDDVHRQVHIFTNTFNICLNQLAPTVTREIKRPFAPWIEDDLKTSIWDKNKLQTTLKNDRSNIILNEQFKQTKKNVEFLLNNAKKEYFHAEFKKSRGNSSATWEVVRDMIPGLKSVNSRLTLDNPVEKANEFNEYFANVGENAFKKSQEGYQRPVTDNDIVNIINNHQSENIPLFRPQPVDVNTVILVIKDLKNTKSFGSDGIQLIYLIDALPVLIIYIVVIVNTSIVTGLYPQMWKHPHVIPFYKSGDVDDVGNYRPISLLPIISKVLEKIVANQLMAFLESHKLLSNTQHGFRANLSTETALMKVNERIYDNIDKQDISLLLLLDLSKAFDSVSHDILLTKCNDLRIDRFWFSDYLSDRIQSVRLESVISNSKTINYGVPQGSILGPILFLIYINDMADVLDKYFLIQYADDSQIILANKITNIEELKLEGEIALSDAKKYFQSNGLNVNEGKTQCMFVGSRQLISLIPPDLTINFGNTTITPLKSVKNLGVYMDQYLLYDVHVNHISRKVNGILMFLNRIKDNFEKSARIIVVQSLVLSIINYCSKIWGLTTKQQIERVQKLENFAAKVASGSGRKYDHATPYLNELKWMKIECKITFDICTFTYKIVNNLLPEWLFSFPQVRNTSARHTRQSGDLFIPRTKTDIGARAISVTGPRAWNMIPKNIREAGTIKTFKEKLKKFFMEK